MCARVFVSRYLKIWCVLRFFMQRHWIFQDVSTYFQRFSPLTLYKYLNQRTKKFLFLAQFIYCSVSVCRSAQFSHLFICLFDCSFVTILLSIHTRCVPTTVDEYLCLLSFSSVDSIQYTQNIHKLKENPQLIRYFVVVYTTP